MTPFKTIIHRSQSGLAVPLEKTVTVCFAVIFLLTIMLVMLRYLFNSSISGGHELIGYLFIYTTSLGAAVSICRNEHIRIAYFVDLLPPVLHKLSRILGAVLVAAINLIIAYLSLSWLSQVGDSPSPVLRIPMWVVEISVPIGCLFSVLFCLTTIIRELLGQEEDDSA